MKTIVKCLSLFLILFAITSCHEIKNKELYEITDRVVESLYTTYEHYDMFGKHIEYTKDKDAKTLKADVQYLELKKKRS